MLLQTNSYVVPRDKRAEHARILRRFRQALIRLGCDHFEVFEQVGPNWNSADTSGRFVQIMRFRDRKHQMAVQAAERNDPTSQALLREFCELINVTYQQQQGLFAVGFYSSFLRMPPQPQNTSQAESAEAVQEQQHEPTGVLSMSQPADEQSTAGTTAIPGADSAAASASSPDQPSQDQPSPDQPLPDQPAQEEPSLDQPSDDHSNTIDFNAESSGVLPDDSADSTDHHAFSEVSDSDLPQLDDPDSDSPLGLSRDAGDTGLDMDSALEADPGDKGGDAETESRSTPFNS